MGKITHLFEDIVEKFLQGDLDRRTRLLAWIALLLLILCSWGGYLLWNTSIPVQQKDTPVKIVIPLKELMFQ